MTEETTLAVKPIGLIRTPYVDAAPYQPVSEAEGEFRIEVFPRYSEGLFRLEEFRYIYVVYYLHRLSRTPDLIVAPPWADGTQVGVFASRSPARPNPIGISIVQIRRIVENDIFTSGLDVFDKTPLLDIKPYIKDLDTKADANYGWLQTDLPRDHLLLHIQGIPHEY
jgi:tRNA-Thr(GGU) m(6)t(6)A37 methyltransferase TsaA